MAFCLDVYVEKISVIRQVQFVEKVTHAVELIIGSAEYIYFSTHPLFMQSYE